MDSQQAAPELIWEGLHLTNVMVVPHMDNKDFIESVPETNQRFQQEGCSTMPLNDNQALLINGAEQKVI